MVAQSFLDYVDVFITIPLSIIKKIRCEKVSNTFRRLHVTCKKFCKLYRLTGNRDVPPCACDSCVLTESLWGTNVEESPEAQMSLHALHTAAGWAHGYFKCPALICGSEFVYELLVTICTSPWNRPGVRMRYFLTASSLNPAEVSLCQVGRWSSSTGGTAPTSRFCLCGD